MSGREPKVNGVSRMFDNERAILVSLSRAVTDDELRALHEFLQDWFPGGPDEMAGSGAGRDAVKAAPTPREWSAEHNPLTPPLTPPAASDLRERAARLMEKLPWPSDWPEHGKVNYYTLVEAEFAAIRAEAEAAPTWGNADIDHITGSIIDAYTLVPNDEDERRDAVARQVRYWRLAANRPTKRED